MKGAQLQVIERPLSALKPYGRNPRTHSQGQIVQIANSIREFGFIVPILIDGDGEIIAGHGRYEAAKLLERDTVPCIEATHLSERQKRAFVIADNKIASRGGWDLELLSAELGELAELDMDLSVTGFDEQEIDGLLKQDLSILPEDWGQPAPVQPGPTRNVYTGPGDSDPFDDDGITARNQYGVIVICEDEADQESVFNRLTAEGYNCKVVVV